MFDMCQHVNDTKCRCKVQMLNNKVNSLLICFPPVTLSSLSPDPQDSAPQHAARWWGFQASTRLHEADRVMLEFLDSDTMLEKQTFTNKFTIECV